MDEQENKTKVTIESESNKLNIPVNTVDTDRKNCSYCNKPFTKKIMV